MKDLVDFAIGTVKAQNEVLAEDGGVGIRSKAADDAIRNKRASEHAARVEHERHYHREAMKARAEANLCTRNISCLRPGLRLPRALP